MSIALCIWLGGCIGAASVAALDWLGYEGEAGTVVLRVVLWPIMPIVLAVDAFQTWREHARRKAKP